MRTHWKVRRVYLGYSQTTFCQAWAIFVRDTKTHTYPASRTSRIRLSKLVLREGFKLYPIIGMLSTGDIGWHAETGEYKIVTVEKMPRQEKENE